MDDTVGKLILADIENCSKGIEQLKAKHFWNGRPTSSEAAQKYYTAQKNLNANINFLTHLEMYGFLL